MLLTQCPMSEVGKLLRPPTGQIQSAAYFCTAPEQWLLHFNGWKKSKSNILSHMKIIVNQIPVL